MIKSSLGMSSTRCYVVKQETCLTFQNIMYWGKCVLMSCINKEKKMYTYFSRCLQTISWCVGIFEAFLFFLIPPEAFRLLKHPTVNMEIHKIQVIVELYYLIHNVISGYRVNSRVFVSSFQVHIPEGVILALRSST